MHENKLRRSQQDVHQITQILYIQNQTLDPHPLNTQTCSTYNLHHLSR